MIKIGDLAKIIGVSVKTIRFYETKKLLSPCEVDRWTGYRYYNEESVKRLSEIKYLKELGFSLKEIASFNENQINSKTGYIKKEIVKLQKNLFELSSIKKNEKGEYIMKNFINDEKAIGKWQKIAVVKNKEEFFKGEAKNDKEIFPYDELYLMENGQEYWVISWTKGFINVKELQNPYEIIDDIMFVSVVDRKSKEIEAYAIYKKIDNKKYDSKDIRVKDNTNISFINDTNVIGFWKSVDFVKNQEDFKADLKKFNNKLFVKEIAFAPNGKIIFTFNDNSTSSNNMATWTKNVVINKAENTASEYLIKNINKKDYLFMEWKSGDYVFGGKICGYYVFEKNE